MKRLLIALLIIAASIFLLIACAGNSGNSDAVSDEAAKEITLGYIPSETGGFFAQLEEGLEKYAAINGNITVVVKESLDTGKKISAIKSLADEGADVIFCHIDDADAIKPTMELVQKKGVKFITYDTEVEGSDAFFGADNFEMGKIIGGMLADWANTTFDSSQTVHCGILNYNPFPFLAQRREGIEAAINEKAPNVVLVDSKQAGLASEGAEVGQEWLSEYPDMLAVAGINDAGAYALYEVWKENGKKDQDRVGIFAVDASEDALQAIKAGEMFRGTGYLDADAISKDIIDCALKLASGATLDSHDHLFICTPVTAANIDEFTD